MRRSTHTTYVKRQDRIEQIGDMLDSAMHQANVARRREITAPFLTDSKYVAPRQEDISKFYIFGSIHSLHVVLLQHYPYQMFLNEEERHCTPEVDYPKSQCKKLKLW